MTVGVVVEADGTIDAITGGIDIIGPALLAAGFEMSELRGRASGTVGVVDNC